jgi:serpin B
MRRCGEYGYLEGDGFQMVQIPYLGWELSMEILLPRAAGGLPALERDLDPENFQEALLRSREVDLSIPRFKVASSFSVAAALKALGMERAFALGMADFSGIAPGSELFIGEVLHKAYVDVNEEGTEAAAATTMAMPMAAMEQEPPVVFKADRPFLFLIRHRETGAILFLGRLADPGDQG